MGGTSLDSQLCMQVFSDDEEDFSQIPSSNTIADYDKVSENGATPLILENKFKWPVEGKNKVTIKVKFIAEADPKPETSAKIKGKVQEYAKHWEKYANVFFDFGNHDDAKIRISFEKGSNPPKTGRSWSAVGTECENITKFPPNKATMNYGWLEDNTTDTEYERVVVHEFGHALGCVHEQWAIPSGGKHVWIQAKVKAAFPRWTDKEVAFNFHDWEPPAPNLYTQSDWDRLSIMHYVVKKDWVTPELDRDVESNTTLSEQDKKFIAQWYPK